MSGNMPAGPPHMHHPQATQAFSPQQQQQQQHHQGRRQSDYHHPQYHPQHFNPYHYPPAPQHHYYGMPQPQYVQPQWYPYQHFSAPPPQPHTRHFQPQGPLVVSSQQPHVHPHYHIPRLPQHPPQHNAQHHSQIPQPVQTPALDESTPSATTSQNVASPVTTPTTTSFQTATPPVASSTSKPALPPPASVPPAPASPPSPEPSEKVPYAYPLPWYSVPEAQFPPKVAKRRRRRKLSELSSDLPRLPSRSSVPVLSEGHATAAQADSQQSADLDSVPVEQPAQAEAEVAASSAVKSSDAEPGILSAKSGAPVPAQRPRAPTRPVVPIIPNIPRRTANQTSTSDAPVAPKLDADATSPVAAPSELHNDAEVTSAVSGPTAEVAPIPRVPPSSWAGLFSRGKAGAVAAAPAGSNASNGAVNGSKPNKSSTLADALRQYSVDRDGKISFLEPRGLVNTGNMCYMNSILQTLVFCVPFYEFLDLVSKRAAHSFKSTTPLVEAMIMFMREYQIIDSANSPEQLRLRLKDAELEQFGEPFIPEYVYEAIKRLPRFSSMRRGQQQDAEEFLGLLLEVLHLECAGVMGSDDSHAVSSAASDVTSERSLDGSSSTADVGGWMEVGHKQKPSVTRSSGGDVESPLTKIFGGKLRSEFRVSGNKNSVTLTPYQQLQLDIGDASVYNVIDALKGLTRSERVDGTFETPRGPQDYGTKQFFIETLPPVLILHLKRFHFEGNTTQKIWKKIGYPLELEIPKEVFAHNKRGQFTSRPQGLPKYRLIGVVYHHGKNASGGHYTVDVRRQEGREWIRLDDTVIRRVRAEDVAGEGGEEDPKVLAKALEQHKRDQQSAPKNIFSQAGFRDEADGEGAESEEGGKEWNQVNGTVANANDAQQKKWSGAVVNGGNATPSTAGKRTPREAPKAAVKDNKVAYILFYEQIRA